MKKHRKEEQFLEELRNVPNISSVCNKIGISRNSVYRWFKEDSIFRTRAEKALRMGNESINDLAENRLVQKIKDSDMRAITYWLDNHKVNYIKPRIEDYLNKMFGYKTNKDDVVDMILKGSGIIQDNKDTLQENHPSSNDPDIF